MNQLAWSEHYKRKKSRLEYPDEFVVSYLKRHLADYLEEKETLDHTISYNKQAPKKFDFYALDLGCGSGRHTKLLKEFPLFVVGQDYILEILRSVESHVVCAKTEKLPFKNNSFDFILGWGILHYLSSKDLKSVILDIKRILKPGSCFLATVRSLQDTHLKKTLTKGDLKGGQATLYSKKEACDLFSSFTKIRYGYISRQLLGDQEKNENIIAHHIIEAVK